VYLQYHTRLVYLDYLVLFVGFPHWSHLPESADLIPFRTVSVPSFAKDVYDQSSAFLPTSRLEWIGSWRC
jgi:hypothetical protein